MLGKAKNRVELVSMAKDPKPEAITDSKMNGTQIGSGYALKRFLDRRRSPVELPKPPHGRSNYAPLELLSGAALHQMRQASSSRTGKQTEQIALPPIQLSRSTVISSSPFAPSAFNLTHQHLGNDFKEYNLEVCSPSGVHRNSSLSQTELRGSISSNPSMENEVTDNIVKDEGDNKEKVGKQLSCSTKGRCQASRFCHICSRTTRKVNNICCKNFSKGTCRKVICEKCFNDYGWNWGRASTKPMEWTCTHCRDCCPSRAQCSIYKRTNERRRENQQRVKQETSGHIKLRQSGVQALENDGDIVNIRNRNRSGICTTTAQIPEYSAESSAASWYQMEVKE